jgi:UDP:flavonoid glycosyltransferase YjiC (YdhE family)
MKHRVLFIPMSWGRGLGPLTDCLAIARSLRENCDIGFVVKDEFIEFTKRGGYSIYNITSPTTHKKITNEFYTDFPYFQGLSDETLLTNTLRDERAAVLDFKPNVIFSWLQFTAAITATDLKVDLVSKANWPEHPGFVPPDFANPVQPSKVTPLFNQILESYKQPLIDSVWDLSFLRSNCKIAPTLPDFEPGLGNVPDLYYVGHLVYQGDEIASEPDWMQNLDGSRKVVFIYLSDKQIDLAENALLLAELFEGTEFQVIVSMGAHVPLDRIPKHTNNVMFEKLVQADSMFSKCDIFVSTGTRGSTWAALLHGVSMVLFPGVDMEMGFNAHNIATYGAGIRLPDEKFFTMELLQAIRKVATPEYRNQAKILGQKIEKLGGPVKAAQIISNLAKANAQG